MYDMMLVSKTWQYAGVSCQLQSSAALSPGIF